MKTKLTSVLGIAAGIAGIAAVTVAPATAFASTTSGSQTSTTASTLSEQQIDQILEQEGVPSSQVSSMPLYFKQAIINKVGTKATYEGSSVQNYSVSSNGSLVQAPINTSSASSMTISPMTISPMTISTSDLTLNEEVFDNSGTYTVMEYFGWNIPYSITDDHVSIAVPSGWDIVAGSESADVQYMNRNAGGWIDTGSSLAGGRPDSISIYGADWQFDAFSVEDQPKGPAYMYPPVNYYQGWLSLNMTKSSSSAMNRVAGEYCSVNPGAGGGAGISIGWGPLSVSYSATSGESTNTAGVDASF